MALILPVLTLLSVGVADLGRGFAAKADANHAAEAAARALSQSSGADYTTAAKDEDTNAWSAYSCTVPTPSLPTAGTGGVIKVYVQCTLSLYTPLVSQITGTVHITAVAVSRAAW